MKTAIFINKHKRILKRYNVNFEPDCDYYSMVNGSYYYDMKISEEMTDDSFIIHIMGIGICDGYIGGDPEGYLKLLSKSLREYRKDPIKFKIDSL